MTLEATVRERVLAEHRDAVEDVLTCAEAAATDLQFPADRDAVVAALEPRLRDADVPARLVDLLRTAVAAAGYEFRADPVPAPPYVVVTGRGPLVRATVADGRLLVLVRAFALADEGYVPAEVGTEAAVEVEFRRPGRD